MLDRKQAPAFQTLTQLQVPKPEVLQVNEKQTIYSFGNGTQDVIALGFMLPNHISSSLDKTEHLASSMAWAGLKHGTTRFDAKALEDTLADCGGYLSLESGDGFQVLNIFALRRYLTTALDLVREMLLSPTYPEKEVAIAKDQRKQGHRVQLEKTSYLAQRLISQKLYGSLHPLGLSVDEQVIDQINRGLIQRQYQDEIALAPKDLFAAGKLTDQDLNTLSEFLSGLPNCAKVEESVLPATHSDPAGIYYVDKPGSNQASLRMGGFTIAKTHPDYIKLRIMNTVFGGYFGSRLMQNIREDKGYTYGIYSQLKKFGPYVTLSIQADIGLEVAEATVAEIHHEAERLQQDLISEAELDLVRNYTLGSIANAANGPFALADLYTNLVYDPIGFDYYERLIDTLKVISPSDIQEMAQKYLNTENMITAIAGKSQA